MKDCLHTSTVRQGDREFCKDCGTFVSLGHAQIEISKIENEIVLAMLIANGGSYDQKE